MNVFDIIALFIFLASLFIFLNIYVLKLPSTIGLMIMALFLSLCLLSAGYLIPSLKIDAIHIEEYKYADIIYQIVLSFLLFSSALNMDFKKLAKHKKAVLVLATVGVLISTAVIGTSVYFMLAWIGIELSFLYCLVFGALISPTDPIAITEYIRRFKISKNVEMKIEGESRFNDGIAVVLALTLLDLAGGQADHQLSYFEVIYVFLADVGGGIFIGLVMGYIGYRLLKYVDNDEFHVEILITITIVLFGTTMADLMHVSSKQAAVIMGLVIGNEGRSTEVTGIAGDYVFKFWNLIQDSFATMLFVLIGLEMLVIPLRFDYFAAGFFAVNLVLLGRWMSVFIPIKILSVKKNFEPHTISIMSWGTLRGGIPIALSLTLPEFSGKDVIITMTYVVVVWTIIYQGLTIPLLIKSLVPNNKN